jgi:glycosyltransferase involved in cell wall biosynthesis
VTAPAHILHLIETGGPGGAERVLTSLALALNATGEVNSQVGLLKDGWVAAELRRHGAAPILFRLRRPLDPALLWALGRHVKRARVDLVHAHEFTMNVYGGVAAALAGVPAVGTVHGRGYYAEAGRRIAALKLAVGLGLVPVAVSSDIQRFLSATLGLPGVRLIPNGIDVDRPASGDRARARAALGLPPGAPVIGAVGNLYAVKGHAVLLRAAAALPPSVHVVIAGRGEEEAALRREAAALGLGDRLHLLGFRDDVPDLLAAFDIYALPSFSEGQSLALLEAMAAGRPIVATAVGGNPELLGAPSPAGLLVPPGDPAALGAALGRLLADPGAAATLAAAARARARAEFSLAVMVGRYRALYAERLAARGGRRAAERRGLGDAR